MYNLCKTETYTAKYSLADGFAKIYINKKYFGRCHTATIAKIKEYGLEKNLKLIKD
jgi:hypothetical protein